MNECPLYTEPELYDLLFPGATDGGDAVRDRARRERIIASERFYVDQARKAGGRVLEMACGSGPSQSPSLSRESKSRAPTCPLPCSKPRAPRPVRLE